MQLFGKVEIFSQASEIAESANETGKKSWGFDLRIWINIYDVYNNFVKKFHKNRDSIGQIVREGPYFDELSFFAADLKKELVDRIKKNLVKILVNDFKYHDKSIPQEDLKKIEKSSINRCEQLIHVRNLKNGRYRYRLNVKELFTDYDLIKL